MFIKPKKYYGQHFLTNASIASRIVNSLTGLGYQHVLEVGPGKGILTKILMQQEMFQWKCVEVDPDMVNWLIKILNVSSDKIILADFLKLNPATVWDEPYAIIGNFPYNISNQIVFHIIRHHQHIPEIIGTFQKEVAQRLVSTNNCKSYGISSIISQLYYNLEILFHIQPGSFYPAPKVISSTVRFRRKPLEQIPQMDLDLFLKFLKNVFSKRRKLLKNSLPEMINTRNKKIYQWLNYRPEQISSQEFFEIYNYYKHCII